jgi:hypothetical protein
MGAIQWLRENAQERASGRANATGDGTNTVALLQAVALSADRSTR